MNEDNKFHWSEGMKYAAEAIKGVFLINGTASISMLTFIGNTKIATWHLVIGLFSFAIGALTGPIAFCLAYLTQLQYGNKVLAPKVHTATYYIVGFGMLAFIVGIVFVSKGLWSALPLKE
jgi:hypothetical protein